MKTSAAGRAAITAREGKRLLAYRDSVGVLTIGVGHTGRMSPPAVTEGMRITSEQCDTFLAADLAPVEGAINSVLKVPVTQNQFDALASFLFNVGIGWAGIGKDKSGKPHPTASILTRLNAGDVKGAAAAFDLFHQPPEVTGRRNQEKAQFLTPDATPVASRPTPSSATPIVNGALNPPAQPTRGPSPAPASSTAATKGPDMSTAATANIHSALPSVDLGAGISNVIDFITGGLKSGVAAAANAKIPQVTSEPGQGGMFFGTIANGQAAIKKIEEITSDARKGNVQEGVADGVDLLKLVFATLDTFKINVPVLTQVIAAFPSIHAGGVDQPA